MAVLEPGLPPGHPLLDQATCGLAVAGSLASGDSSPTSIPAIVPPAAPCIEYARWGLANPVLLRLAGLGAGNG